MKLFSSELNTRYFIHYRELAIFFSLFVLLFSSIRLYPSGSIGNVEQWINLTNSMFARDQDFLFSYGPLYWLVGGVTTPYNQITFWSAILYLSINFAFFWSVLLILCIDSKRYISFGLAFVIFILTLQVNSALFLWPLMVVAYLDFYKERKSILTWKKWIIFGLIVGSVFYVRFFFGLIASAIFITYLISNFKNYGFIKSIIGFSIAVMLTYVIVGFFIFHDSLSIIKYLIINMQLNFGNSVDMTLDVKNTTATFICAFIVLICFSIHCLTVRRYLLLTYIALWVILFKLGFGRSDHYNTYFVIPMIFMSLILACEKLPIGRVLFGVNFITLLYLASHQTFPGAATIKPFATSFNFAENYNDRMMNIYNEYKLDPEIIDIIKDSTIDVYPYNNEYLLANKLNYLARPLFQNYMTLTPSLDKMNKDFFESKESPEFILWTGGLTCYSSDCNIFEGFDYKYALNEDPLTVTSILNNYNLIKVTHGRGNIPILLLKKTNKVVDSDVTSIEQEVMKFGVWYKMPEYNGEVIKIQPNFKFTLLGRLKNLLFRGGIVKVKYKLESGDIKEFRLNILNSNSGVWASPLLTGVSSNGFEGEAVKSVMFETQSKLYLDNTFHANIVKMNLSFKINPRVINYNRFATIESGFQQKTITCDGSIDEINGKQANNISLEDFSNLQVKGWLAASSKHGRLYDHVYLLISNDDNQSLFVNSNISNRIDVANAFKHSILERSGFASLVNIKKLNGKYNLGLAGMSGNKMFICNNINYNLIINN